MKEGNVGPSEGQLVLPMLELIATAGGAMRPGELYDQLAHTFGIDEETRNATVTYGAKSYKAWERKVRWARQTAVAKGLIKRESRGVWELTDHANVALRNARRGVILTAFETGAGIMFWSCAEDVVAAVERESLNLIFTSPPYPLLKPKAYGNLPAREWLDWMLKLCESWHELLTPDGSLMLNLGTVWNPGEPTVSDYIERLTIELQDKLGYHFCQRLEWFSRSRLPNPIEYVAIRRCRVTPATEALLWFGKSADVAADNRRVLRPYSESMKRVLRDGQRAARRPSGNVFTERSFSVDNGGSIPTNVIDIANSASNDAYRRACRERGLEPHPATFPEQLARFGIGLCTQEYDRVADFFAGSGTVAHAAESMNRYWVCSDRSRTYLEGARLRFPELAAAS